MFRDLGGLFRGLLRKPFEWVAHRRHRRRFGPRRGPLGRLLDGFVTVIIVIAGILFFLGIAVALFALIGLFVMLLWNWLMPDIFGLPELSYFQAVGLLVLTRMLFGTGSSGSKSS